MDLLTQYYYSNNAERITRKHAANRTGISAWFATAFPKESRILDIGTGSGVNLACLLEGNHDVLGVEPCQAFISGAEAMYPQVQGRIIEDSLPYLQSIPDGEHDGILCSDVLMHLPEEELFDAVFNFRRVLRPGGCLLVSLPLDAAGVPFKGRDDRGLLYNGLSSLRLELFLARQGFVCKRRGEIPDVSVRNRKNLDIRLFVLNQDLAERRIDRIRSFLEREDEAATYGVALVRAIAEIGMTQYHRVRCLPEGTVALPIGAVAEKWIEYYWPLLDSEKFIPQMRIKTFNVISKISFREVLSELVRTFRPRGGLDAFLVARRSRSMTPDEMVLVKKVMARLCDTIRLGAILHVRGKKDGDTLFRYEGKSKCLVLESTLWSEFSLQSAWIRDAAILRWAGLINRFSDGSVTTDQAVCLLVHPPLPERQASDVQMASMATGSSTCVWTGECLKGEELEATRAIPFSLWHNNDLWNLFPAQKGVRILQADRLPTRRLIHARKREILQTWDRTFRSYPERFRSETALLAGTYITQQRNWPHRLFALFCEAVEFTALQLQTPRWEP